MKQLNKQNLEQFRLIDEIHSGYVELHSSHKLQQKLQRHGGTVHLKPVERLNFTSNESLVVKCKQTGNFYKAVIR